MAYTLGNKCAKNLCKRTVLLQLIIENVVTCFFWNTVYIPVAPVAVPDTAAERGRSLNAVRQALPDAALPGGRRRLPRRLAAGLSLGVVTALSVDDSQAAGSYTACRVF